MDVLPHVPQLILILVALLPGLLLTSRCSKGRVRYSTPPRRQDDPSNADIPPILELPTEILHAVNDGLEARDRENADLPPILKLPTEILHAVYDRLEARDRLSLNLALPKSMRVSKTVVSDANEDATVALVEMLFAKLPKSEISVSSELNMFMRERHNHPTFVRILDGIDNPDDRTDTSLSARMDAMAADFSLGRLDNKEKYLAPGEISWAESETLTYALAQGTLDGFRRISGDDVGRGIIEMLLASEEGQDIFAFTIVNFANRAMMEHVVRGSDPIMSGVVARLAESNFLTGFAGRPRCVSLVEEFIPIPYEVKQKMLKKAIESAKFEAAFAYLEQGVRL
jgi:hypothetical protein